MNTPGSGHRFAANYFTLFVLIGVVSPSLQLLDYRGFSKSRVGWLIGVAEASEIVATPANLQIFFPQRAYAETAMATYRFGGRADPDASLFLEGQPLRVYPTGAFAGLLDLKPGPNRFVFSACRQGGTTVTAELNILRTSPPEPVPAGERRFGPVADAEPADEQWVRPGDRVRIRCRAGAGLAVAFQLGPNAETPCEPLSETQPGLYETEWEISFLDDLHAARVTFVFVDAGGKALPVFLALGAQRVRIG